MSARGLLARTLIGVAVALAVLLAVLGGLGLRGHQAGPLVLAAGVGACLGAVLSAELPRRAGREATWRAAAWTVGGLLLLGGSTAIGGLPAASVVVAVLAAAAAARWWVRPRPPQPAPVPVPRRLPGSGADVPPVASLSTDALGWEWMRTARAMDAALQPDTRAHLVGRRRDLLDEIERRDPGAVARWLAEGPRAAGDPSTYVEGGPSPDPAS